MKVLNKMYISSNQNGLELFFDINFTAGTLLNDTIL